MRISKTKLYNLLKAHGWLHTNNYGLGKELLDLYEPIEARWEGGYTYLSTVPTKKDAVTYDSCRECIVRNLGSRSVRVEMTVWDGEAVHGRRIGKRCTYVFNINRVGPKLTSIVDRWVTELAERVLQQEDEYLYRKRLAAAKEELLKGATN